MRSQGVSHISQNRWRAKVTHPEVAAAVNAPYFPAEEVILS
jgi:hypothetical protein